MALTKTPIELSSTPSIVDGGNDTAITIDSSDNVLVGKTASNSTVSGSQLNSNGLIIGTTSATNPLLLNRLSTDGDIITMQKDGAPVGSIGTLDGNSIYIGNGEVNLRLIGVTNDIRPVTSAGTNRDAAVDLGDANARFKDLYLSGGAYLGGTAAANKLDDYEEGAWTPLITGDSGSTSGQSYGAVTGHYAKIGQLVYLGFDFSLTAVGSVGGSYAVISNLPFPALSSNLGGGSLGYYTGLSNTTGPITFYVAASQAYLMEGGNTYVASSDITNSTRLIGFLSYRTSA